ncbi:MAG TPA: response regulator [Vicinamibacterales bacterium]
MLNGDPHPTILVVEDDPDTRELMTAWLDAEGYRVRTATNGKEALKILQREVPCAMLVDLMMPIMDGAEFRRRVQTMPAISSVPFIMVSACSNAARVARDLNIDVVGKPFDADQLLALVASRCHLH